MSFFLANQKSEVPASNFKQTSLSHARANTNENLLLPFFTEKLLSRNLIFVGECKGSNFEVNQFDVRSWKIDKHIYTTNRVPIVNENETEKYTALTAFTKTDKFRGKTMTIYPGEEFYERVFVQNQRDSAVKRFLLQ